MKKYQDRGFKPIQDEDGTWILPCYSTRRRFEDGEVRPHVYRFGNDTLGYVGTKYRELATLRRKHQGVFSVIVDGESECIVTFAESDFDRVTATLRPRRKQKISAARREVLIARLASLQERKKPARKGVEDGQNRLEWKIR